MAGSEQLFVNVEARITELEKGMKRAQAISNKAYAGMKRDSRSAALQMESDMKRSVDRIGGMMSNFGKGLVGGLVAGGVTGLVDQLGQIAKSVASIGDEAKRAGLGIKQFQELKFVAEQNRIGVDSLVDGLKELNLRADEFIVTGKGPAAEAFARLGYSAETLREKLKDPKELLIEIIGKLRQLDKAAQIRIADEIFGGTAGERFVELISQGEAGIRKTIQTANDLGIVMDKELIEKAAELDRQFNLVTQTVGTALKTAIVEAATALQGFIQQFRQFDAEYAARRRAMELGTLSGELVGSKPSGTTPKTDRLPRVNVPFSQLGPMDMTRQVALYNARDSISKIESGGNYKALGPITSSGDRAYGKYQVMGSNIADWTKKAIGTVLTPEQFLNNPAFQDKVFDHIFGGYIDQFGAEGAAQAWFGGPGAVGKSSRTDQLGTSVGQYGQQFMAGMKDQWEGLREVTAGYNTELERQQQAYQQMGQIANTVFDGLVNALADGKIEGQELLQILMSVVQQMMQMSGMGGGGGGLFGSLFGGLFGGGSIAAGIPGPWGASIMHNGGVAGSGGLKRNVHPGLFANAPRMHGGGVALRPDEIPAILQRGEVVLPRGTRAGGGGPVTNHVKTNIIVNTDGRVTADQSSEAGRRLSAAVQEEVVRMQRPGGLLAGTARR